MPIPLSMFGTSAAFGGPAGPYVQNRVNNNGDGYLGANNTGSLQSTDSDQFVCSLWIKTTEVKNDWIFTIGQDLFVRFSMYWNNSAPTSRLRVNIGSGSASDILNASTTEEYTIGEWHHILVARSGTTLHLYIDDVAATITSPSAGTQPFNTIDTAGIPARADGANPLGSELGDCWYYAGEYLDLSVEANRRKFIDADKAPVDLGSTGQLPTGSTPDIFLGGSMVADDWNAGTNLGTFGSFIQGGSSFTDVPAGDIGVVLNYIAPSGGTPYRNLASLRNLVSLHNPVTLDQTNDLYTVSAWFNYSGVGTRSVINRHFRAGERQLSFEIDADGHVLLNVEWNSGASTNISTSTEVVGVGNHHVVASIQSGFNQAQCYLDGAPLTMVQSGNSSMIVDIDWSRFALNRVFDNKDSNITSMSQPYEADAYVDLSVPAQLEKFIREGQPVDLGPDGTASGAPTPFQYHDPNSTAVEWNSAYNAGDGGDYTLAGSGVFIDVIEPATYINKYNSGTGVLIGENELDFGTGTTKDFTASFWVASSDVAAATQFFNLGATATAGDVQVLRLRYRLSENPSAVQVNYKDTSDGNAFNVQTDSNTTFDKTQRHHFMLAINATGITLAIDDVVVLSDEGPISGAWDWSLIDSLVFGATGVGGAVMEGDYSELWCDRTFIDPTVESNRRKFITSGLEAVEVGPNGELPTGSTPGIYFSGQQSDSDWDSGINLGSAGVLSTSTSGWTSGPPAYIHYDALESTLVNGVWQNIGTNANNHARFVDTNRTTVTVDGFECIKFQASYNDVAELTTSEQLNTDFTVECWVLLDSAADIGMIAGGASNNTQILRSLDEPGQKYLCYLSNTTLASDDSIISPTFAHFAITRAGSDVKLWYNGVEKASASINPRSSDDLQVLGAMRYNGGPSYLDLFSGHMANFKFYKQALSSGVIQNTYAAGCPTATSAYAPVYVDNQDNTRLISSSQMDTGDGFTTSFWFKLGSVTEARDFFMGDSAFAGWSVRTNNGATEISFHKDNFGGVATFPTGSALVPGTLYNLLVSYDSTAPQATRTRMYLNNAELNVSSNTVSGALPFNNTMHVVGSKLTDLNAAAFSEFWFDRSVLDLTDADVRGAFIDQSTLEPVYLGAAGELPSGSSPDIMFGSQQSVVDWNAGANLGTLGSFNTNGAGFIASSTAARILRALLKAAMKKTKV